MAEKNDDLGRGRIKSSKGSEEPIKVRGNEVTESLLLHLERKAKSVRDKVKTLGAQIINSRIFKGVTSGLQAVGGGV